MNLSPSRRPTRSAIACATIALGLTFPVATSAAVSTFEELRLPGESLPIDGTFLDGPYGPPPAGTTTTFTSGPARYGYTGTDFGFFRAWTGWAWSNVRDVETPGFGNQYASYHLGLDDGGLDDGGGRDSAHYGVAFGSADTRVELVGRTPLAGAWFTNTTYAALSMRDGDAFAKRFGGVDGSDPDFFRLTIIGLDGAVETGRVDFMLADYRFDDADEDYIVDRWTFVDLTGLGSVTALAFAFESSDVGPFGINTPTYFAMDDLTAVPLPPMALPFVLAVLGAVRTRARREHPTGSTQPSARPSMLAART